jgi:hypothetical protein
MNEELWAGADLKLEHAGYHFTEMARLVAPPERTAWDAALASSGAIVGGSWQLPFYAHLDALLSAARSIPEIIQCCFGEDRAPQMRTWFAGLASTEQTRRREFRNQFDAQYAAFRALPLGTARHISEHRSGVAPAKVRLSGLFGVTYIGSPANILPSSEIRRIDDPDLAFLAKNHPLRPSWTDFTMQGQPLFDACREYLHRAQGLVAAARQISDAVHGTNALTPPPD